MNNWFETTTGMPRYKHVRLSYGNNFPLNCSLAPPTRAAETTSETEAVIPNLYPTSKSKMVVWEYFGYRKDEMRICLQG